MYIAYLNNEEDFSMAKGETEHIALNELQSIIHISLNDIICIYDTKKVQTSIHEVQLVKITDTKK